jgi:hypothetical protein
MNGKQLAALVITIIVVGAIVNYFLFGSVHCAPWKWYC